MKFHPKRKPAFILGFVLAGFIVAGAGTHDDNTKNITLSAYSLNNDTNAVAASSLNTKESATASIYGAVGLENVGLQEDVFTKAVNGMEKLAEEGKISHTDIITIIDFSQPSNQKRLYVVDLKNKTLLFNSLVAHGRNSGTLMTTNFSNSPSSLMSSPGFYATAETYMGDNGFSLRLDGLEKNINDNARARAVVMHGAPYVDQSHINSMGFIGRSWGCPAIPVSLHKAIINTIKGGSCLFIYSPSASYQHASSLINA